jgi:hypothetical protein
MNGSSEAKGFATMPTTIATMPTITTTTTTQVPNIHPTTSFTFKGNNAISPLSCNANGSLVNQSFNPPTSPHPLPR